MIPRAIELSDILIEIFLHLSQQDLLLIQRTCRRWRSLISDSRILQQALFLCPSFETPLPHPEWNPLLKSKFPSFFDGSRTKPIRAGLHSLGPWDRCDWARGADAGTDREFVDAPVLDGSRCAAYARKEASWRRMVPCRPAPTELQVTDAILGRLRVNRAEFKALRFGSGNIGPLPLSDLGDEPGPVHGQFLTFGLVYDIAQMLWFQLDDDSNPATSFSLQYSLRSRTGSDFLFLDARRNQQAQSESGQNTESGSGNINEEKLGASGVGCLIMRLERQKKYSGSTCSSRGSGDGGEDGNLEVNFSEAFQSQGRIAIQDIVWNEQVRYP